MPRRFQRYISISEIRGHVQELRELSSGYADTAIIKDEYGVGFKEDKDGNDIPGQLMDRYVEYHYTEEEMTVLKSKADRIQTLLNIIVGLLDQEITDIESLEEKGNDGLLPYFEKDNEGKGLYWDTSKYDVEAGDAFTVSTLKYDVEAGDVSTFLEKMKSEANEYRGQIKIRLLKEGPDGERYGLADRTGVDRVPTLHADRKQEGKNQRYALLNSRIKDLNAIVTRLRGAAGQAKDSITESVRIKKAIVDLLSKKDVSDDPAEVAQLYRDLCKNIEEHDGHRLPGSAVIIDPLREMITKGEPSSETEETLQRLLNYRFNDASNDASIVRSNLVAVKARHSERVAEEEAEDEAIQEKAADSSRAYNELGNLCRGIEEQHDPQSTELQEWIRNLQSTVRSGNTNTGIDNCAATLQTMKEDGVLYGDADMHQAADDMIACVNAVMHGDAGERAVRDLHTACEGLEELYQANPGVQADAADASVEDLTQELTAGCYGTDDSHAVLIQNYLGELGGKMNDDNLACIAAILKRPEASWGGEKSSAIDKLLKKIPGRDKNLQLHEDLKHRSSNYAASRTLKQLLRSSGLTSKKGQVLKRKATINAFRALIFYRIAKPDLFTDQANQALRAHLIQQLYAAALKEVIALTTDTPQAFRASREIAVACILSVLQQSKGLTNDEKGEIIRGIMPCDPRATHNGVDQLINSALRHLDQQQQDGQGGALAYLHAENDADLGDSQPLQSVREGFAYAQPASPSSLGLLGVSGGHVEECKREEEEDSNSDEDDEQDGGLERGISSAASQVPSKALGKREARSDSPMDEEDVDDEDGVEEFFNGLVTKTATNCQADLDSSSQSAETPQRPTAAQEEDYLWEETPPTSRDGSSTSADGDALYAAAGLSATEVQDVMLRMQQQQGAGTEKAGGSVSATEASSALFSSQVGDSSSSDAKTAMPEAQQPPSTPAASTSEGVPSASERLANAAALLSPLR